MTIHSPAIRAYLEGVPHSVDIPLMNDASIQLLLNIEDLAKARVYQFAACIALKSMLVVWDDDAVNILQRAKSIEWELMQLLWSSDTDNATRTAKMDKKNDLSLSEKELSDGDSSLEEGGEPKERPIMYINTVLVSLAMLPLVSVLGEFSFPYNHVSGGRCGIFLDFSPGSWTSAWFSFIPPIS
jgi:hypothetical protein